MFFKSCEVKLIDAPLYTGGGGAGGGPSYTTFQESQDSEPQFLGALSNYSVRVGHTVTFTCQAKNVKGYKVNLSVLQTKHKTGQNLFSYGYTD